jgi:predicted transcriptional regulator
MDRSQQIRTAEALNEAIWLRDNVAQMDKEKVKEGIVKLGDYKIFSCRQLSAIVNGVFDHGAIAKIVKKEDKTGGALNVGTLETLRNILYSRANSRTDFELIKKAIEEGNSQLMISKLTGVSQSSISRRLNE